METRKKVVISTALCALLFLGGAIGYQVTRPLAPIVLNIEGQPIIGTGKTQLVVFEDLCCANCRVFTEEIFPEITRRYIDTGRAQLIWVPIAFGEHSKPLANAALSVYHIAPQSFVAFIEELSRTQASTTDPILAVASSIGGIELTVLKQQIDQKVYYAEIERNLYWAKSLMGEDFGTPTLLVDGIQIPAGSLHAIDKQIGKAP